MARIVGPKGHVYGIDIDKEALHILNNGASEMGLNIRIIEGDAEKTHACEGGADIVFFGICLHDFAEPEKVLANAWRMLKPGGILADFDGKKVNNKGESRPGKRLSEKEASKLIKGANFNVESVEDYSDWLYLIIAKK